MEKYEQYTEDILYSQYIKMIWYFYEALNYKSDKYIDRFTTKEDYFKHKTFGWPTQLYVDLDKYIKNIMPLSDEMYYKIAADACLDVDIVTKIVNSNYFHMTLSIINKKAILDGNMEVNSFWSIQKYLIAVHDFRETYKKFKHFYDGKISKKDIKVLSSYFGDSDFNLVKTALSKATHNSEFIIFLNTLIEDSQNPAFVNYNNGFLYNLRTPNDEDDRKAIITYNTDICNSMIDDILSCYSKKTDCKNIQRLREERKK